MKKFILSLAVVALAWGCATDETSDIQQLVGDKTTIEAELASVRTHMAEDGFKVLWSKGDQIGVVLADATIVPFTLKEEFAGQSSGLFEGTLAEGAEVKSAIYPYSASGITIAREQSVASTSTDISAGDVAVATLVDGKLSFTSKVALFAVSFKNIEGSMIAGKKIQTVKVAGDQKDFSGNFNCSTDDVTAVLTGNGTYPEVSLKFTDEPAASAEVMGYLAMNPAIAANNAFDIYVKADGKWYHYIAKAKATLVAGTRYNLAIDAAQLKETIQVDWAYKIGGYSSTGNSPAIDDNGNVYFNGNYDATNQLKLFKIKNDGSLAWVVQPGYVAGKRVSPSVEKDGSYVYILNGKDKDAKTGLYVLNGNDGSVYKSFLEEKFYAANNGTPDITVNDHMCPAYDDNYIYLGNGGTTGAVLAVKKSDFSRMGYAAPSGGAAGGFAISNAGKIATIASWSMSITDIAKLTSTNGLVTADKAFRHNSDSSWDGGNSQGVVCGYINGVEHFFYHVYEKTGTKNFIAAVKADGSTNTPTYVHETANAGAIIQDQGGIILGTKNEVIVPLKKKTNLTGGLYAVGTDGQIAWKYYTNTNVSSAPIIDNAGCVHFADESGYYYIVKPDFTNKSATLVAKVRVVDILRNAGVQIGTHKTSKAWTAIVLDKNGKIYLASNINGNDTHLLRMSYYQTTGVGNSSWPMKFGNQYHSCHPIVVSAQ